MKCDKQITWIDNKSRNKTEYIENIQNPYNTEFGNKYTRNQEI